MMMKEHHLLCITICKRELFPNEHAYKIIHDNTITR
jgi:hypothetical protein